MRTMPRWPWLWVLSCALSLLVMEPASATAQQEGPGQEGLGGLGAGDGATLTSTLYELNNSGGSGEARVVVAPDGKSITVEVLATGLNLDAAHPMHMHGIVQNNIVVASACPTMEDDSDGDGVLTVVEGAPKYGPIQISLTTTGDTSPDSGLAAERFPAGNEITYLREGIVLPEPLQGQVIKLHIVVHGYDENGNGVVDLDQVERSSLTDELPREAVEPALCGTLTVAPDGPIQTGGGGLAGAGLSFGLPLGQGGR